MPHFWNGWNPTTSTTTTATLLPGQITWTPPSGGTTGYMPTTQTWLGARSRVVTGVRSDEHNLYVDLDDGSYLAIPCALLQRLVSLALAESIGAMAPKGAEGAGG